MSHAESLWLFFTLVFGIVLVPGLDMAFVVASSLTGGRRAGLFALFGIVAGGMCHLLAGTLGFATILEIVPGAYNAMLLAGAAYTAWIGVSLLRLRRLSLEVPVLTARSPAARFAQGAMTNLLNPKAYLFMLAIFPQFLKPEFGPVWKQALWLGLITAGTQVAVYGGFALAAGRGGEWLATSPRSGAAIGQAAGLVLLVVAGVTAVQGWRGP